MHQWKNKQMVKCSLVKKYKEGCYFFVELHPDLREQLKISMHLRERLVRTSPGIYLLIYLGPWKVLGSIQDVINLRRKSWPIKWFRKRSLGFLTTGFETKIDINTHPSAGGNMKNMYYLCSTSLNRSEHRNWTKRLYVAGYKHKE